MNNTPNEQPAGGGATDTAAPDAAALARELEAARAEAADYKDRFLRAKAEAENARRRAELDVAAAHKYALERFAGEVVAVRDSLDLARSVELHVASEEAVQKMHEGLELTLRLLDGVFQKFGIRLIDPKGERFDPARHQAISAVESAETPANHVVSVVQKGYLLHDRVLRPAMVIVARERPPQAPPPENPAAGA